jgi:hypothetical protein
MGDAGALHIAEALKKSTRSVLRLLDVSCKPPLHDVGCCADV